MELPSSLELCCPQEIIDWIKTKLPGLRYITLKIHLEQNKYNQFAKISLQENPSPTQAPEEKADRICETIYLILQSKVEELDNTVNFQIQTYQKTIAGDKASTKHITVGMNAVGERESKSYNPDQVAPTILDAQAMHIQMLQDNMEKMYTMMTGMFGSVIETNKQLQSELASKREDDFRIRNLEYTHRVWEKEQEHTFMLEQAKLKASKEKWDSFGKMLNKDGALSSIMKQAANKFMGGNNPPPPDPPKVSKHEQKVYPSHPPKQEPKQSDEDIQKEEERIAEENLKNAPLHTYCSYLKASLDTEILENPDENAKKYIEEILRDSLYKDLMDLLNSESEEEAKKNLLQFRNNIEAGDYEGLFSIQNVLSIAQKSLIQKIMDYNPEE